MEKLKTRDEIEDKYKWDLTRIYENDEEWEKDYQKVWDLSDRYKNFEGNLFSSKESLLDFYRLKEYIDKHVNKLHLYSHLNNSVDVADTNYIKKEQKMNLLYQKISNNISYFDEEFFNSDYDKLKEILDSDEELSCHKLYFERLNRNRKHYLDSNSQKILSSFSNALNTGSGVYEILNNAELKFGTITLEDGKEVEISRSSLAGLLKNKNRRVRKESFEKFNKIYEDFSGTFSAAYMGDVDSNIAIARLKNFDSKREQSLFKDNISLAVYDNLIKEINNGLPYLYDYYKFKKEALGLDEFHLYDTYIDIIKDKSVNTYTYEEALDLVFDGLKPLGSEYLKKLKRIVDLKLIDVMPNKNKVGGGFNSSTYDTDSYILLNFGGRYEDVLTVGHEAGHSIHCYYSNINNIRDYAEHSIFVSEIASTVNELLISYNLLDKSNDPKEKLYIMNSLLDNYKSVIFTQTMFAEFEKEIYTRKEKGESLTKDDICECYYDLNKKYFGSDVIIDDEIKYGWEKISHFYSPFYVYKYATSMSASIVIANRIYNGDTEFRDRYINFLKLGGSMFPLDEIRTLGIEMEDGKLFRGAMESFNNLREKFEKQYNEVYGEKNKSYVKK